MWIFVVLYILLGSCCLCATGQTYSFSDAATDWSSAATGCHPAIPATPTIRYTSVYNETFSFLIDTGSLPDLEGANLWVGYYASNQVFKYEGCVYEPDEHVHGAHVASHRVARRPGACFSACHRSPLFGMLYKDHSDGRDNCFCYDEAPNTSLYHTVCTMTCTQPHVACGNYHYISLYSHVTTTTSFQRHQTHPGDCVSYTRAGNSGGWHLTLCDVGVLCETGNRFWEPTVQSRDWLSTSMYCFTQAQHPARVIKETMASYENELHTLENGIWTVPSNDIITKCGNEHVTDERTGKVIEATSVAPEQYGYLETRDDDVYLKFTPVPSPPRRVLCGTGFTTTTRKPNTATKRRDTTYTQPVTTSQDTTAIEVMATTTSAVSMTTGNGNGNPEATSARLTNTPSDGEDNVPVIVGTCVGLFVLIVIVVGVILWKRCKNRQHPPMKGCHDIKLDNDVGPTTTNYYNVGPTTTDYINVDPTTTDYHNVTVPNNTPDHIYTQLVF